MPFIRLSHLVTKWGEHLPLGDLNVLIGPNNAGKSRTLAEVVRGLTGKMPSGVVADPRIIADVRIDTVDLDGAALAVKATTSPGSDSPSAPVLAARLDGTSEAYFHIPMLRAVLRERSFDALSAAFVEIVHGCGQALVGYSDAATRLSVLNEGQGCHWSAAPVNLQQALFTTRTDVELSSRDFEAAFDFALAQQRSTSGVFRFRTGRGEQLRGLPTVDYDRDVALDVLTRLEDEGSGRRSIAAVVATLLAVRNRLLLIDEPEAFLHPSLAMRLGQWVAEHARRDDQQIILATHNAAFLSGLIGASRDVTIYRLDRVEDRTSFRLVPPVATNALLTDHLASSQRAHEALFAEGAVVVEADGDRMIYDAVAVREAPQRRVFFVNANGKDTVAGLTRVLRSSGTPCVALLDIDVLRPSPNAVDLLDELLNALGADPSRLPVLLQQRDWFQAEVDRLQGANTSARWKSLKRNGLAVVPEPARSQMYNFLGDLGREGLFLLPVGEIEGWGFPGATRLRKGGKWYVAAVDDVQQDNTPAHLRSFISRVVTRVLVPLPLTTFPSLDRALPLTDPWAPDPGAEAWRLYRECPPLLGYEKNIREAADHVAISSVNTLELVPTLIRKHFDTLAEEGATLAQVADSFGEAARLIVQTAFEDYSHRAERVRKSVVGTWQRNSVTEMYNAPELLYELNNKFTIMSTDLKNLMESTMIKLISPLVVGHAGDVSLARALHARDIAIKLNYVVQETSSLIKNTIDDIRFPKEGDRVP